ncbi:nucleoside-diphosphate-sugar epimerase [Arcticibacter tournemirensis]|uniref:NAD-dependent epimerase/dehydratase family protein n=1 Tax=Arcticibacter tournemirensis TaxID=699437 RepID=A0A4Q0M623_9SPHI|nr:NAD-dependent epimerase/dehydratase family protein [Arcticibacter tournemirensis]KAA8480202.1 NAD-dependent epimerase/dehydratase family protein [Arcticibacter tournemirensis]RXF68283.1 NAD-dependent epimerase/dehydratase family protein [Arcticibacter tournemirensis]TQM52684.1 nucleoside-diphosphate-sugar epimerase [Arcticibacter tournemirensis]
MHETILVIGANGQIGTELVTELRNIYGGSEVVACDIRRPDYDTRNAGPFEFVNVLDKDNLKAVCQKYKPSTIYLLAAILSATGEQNPKLAWDLNMNGLLNVLDFAIEFNVRKVYWPSSIAVFGPGSPKDNTSQFCVMDPNTVYGISKLAGERWCEYYFQKHGLDVRSLRYPGLISWKAAPGGGTTDYAVHIFHDALKKGSYSSFLSADTRLPMMYMDDAIRGTIELMEAPAAKVSIRSSYNFAGMDFTPEELASEIRKHIPDFKLDYTGRDPRQLIANSWPRSIDDSFAKNDWNWKTKFDLPQMTEEMLTHLKK